MWKNDKGCWMCFVNKYPHFANGKERLDYKWIREVKHKVLEIHLNRGHTRYIDPKTINGDDIRRLDPFIKKGLYFQKFDDKLLSIIKSRKE